MSVLSLKADISRHIQVSIRLSVYEYTHTLRGDSQGPVGPLSFCPLSHHPPSPFARHRTRCESLGAVWVVVWVTGLTILEALPCKDIDRRG